LVHDQWPALYSENKLYLSKLISPHINHLPFIFALPLPP